MEIIGVILLFCCVILINVVGILTYENSDCTNLKETENKPRDCCEFPILYVNHTTLQKCFRTCPSIKSDDKYENDEEKQKDECCLVKCIHEVEEVVDKMGASNLENLKYSFRSRNGSFLSDEWQKVVDKAVDKCGEKFPQSDQIESCLPAYHRKVLKCTYISSFLNCVDSKRTARCIALRKSVQDCTNSNDMSLEAWSIFFA
ncbi:unnamed protein product [Chironomus riparius]|uniref:Odorant binding protein n=1 Tax=Chironomus riparius TaxID=315576 RepID=A0A9N9SB08_9DIPT|nr:unnamed protein product [Chironomus riparius]